MDVPMLWLLLLLLLSSSPVLAAGGTLSPPPHAPGCDVSLRLYNPHSDARTVAIRSESGTGLTIDPGQLAEIPGIPTPQLDLSGLVATWHVVGGDADLQLRADAIGALECGEPVRVLVAGTACRFGTAGALVEELAGATYRWTIEGGAILSGEGTASPVFSFGASSAAILRVEIAASGCTRIGTATIALRAPFEIVSLTSAPATANAPVSISWTYRDNESPRTQRLSIAGARVAVPLAARTYTFTPATAGAIEVALEASLIGGRRRAVAFPGPSVPSPSVCSSDQRSLLIDVRPACTLPEGSIAVSGPTSFCEGGSVTLTAPEGTSYEWNTGARSRSITVNSSGSYEVRVGNGAGCERLFGPVHVNETRRPAISLALSPSAIEAGGEATIMVTCQRCAGGSVTSARGPNSLTPNGGVFSGSGTFTFAFRDTQGAGTLAFTATGAPLPPCGQGAADQETLSIVAPAPQIASFTADSYIVGWGATTTLRFTIANAASWRLLSSRGNCKTPSTSTGSGSFTSTYGRCSFAGPDVITLEVTGTNGTVITRDLPQPIEGPAQLLSFTADSYTVPFFGTTTLRFTINYAASWRLLSSKGNGRTPSSGTDSGSLTSTYTRGNMAGADTITLEVTGKDGVVITQNLPQPIN